MNGQRRHNLHEILKTAIQLSLKAVHVRQSEERTRPFFKI